MAIAIITLLTFLLVCAIGGWSEERSLRLDAQRRERDLWKTYHAAAASIDRLNHQLDTRPHRTLILTSARLKIMTNWEN